MRALLRRFAHRCEVHDGASPRRIAELEAELGVNPNAVRELMATVDLITAFDDPRLTDCGHAWCETRQRNDVPVRLCGRNIETEAIRMAQ